MKKTFSVAHIEIFDFDDVRVEFNRLSPEVLELSARFIRPVIDHLLADPSSNSVEIDFVGYSISFSCWRDPLFGASSERSE